jgi:hypothetical protein
VLEVPEFLSEVGQDLGPSLATFTFMTLKASPWMMSSGEAPREALEPCGRKTDTATAQVRLAVAVERGKLRAWPA